MRRVLTEQTVLFISVLKWVVLATFIGGVVGVSTTIFLKALNFGTGLTGSHPYYFLLLPVAMMVSGLLVMYLAPDAEGHGTERVIEAVHRYSGRIKLAVVPVKLVATVITIAGGGSAGKEGPCAQIGAGLASAFADLFRFDAAERKKLVICGISAGFASVFGTPIAASIMAVELFGLGIAPYAGLACVLSFVMTGHKSVYPSQVLAIRKSPSIEIETGKEIESVAPRLKVRRRSLLYILLKLGGKVRKG